MTQKGQHSDFRFERKFLTDQLSFSSLERLVKQHPACFTEIFQERRVNNIYFDTPSLNFFDDNIAGKSARRKVRIRWYGQSMDILKNPVLEFKIKEGQLGMKSSYLLPDISLAKQISFGFFEHWFKSSDLPGAVIESLLLLEPVLLNYYNRKYFQSFDKDFRFTIDKQMTFCDFKSRQRGWLQSYEDLENRVLELKYSQDLDEKAAWIVNHLPIRMTKSSKYVMGVNRFRPDLAL